MHPTELHPPRVPAPRPWGLALQVAGVAGVLAVALGASLAHFVGLPGPVILLLTAAAGLVIGWHLPPATPVGPARFGSGAATPGPPPA